MKHLDLFSGIGGFPLAAYWAGFETIGLCEIDNHCRQVLKRHWPNVPIHEDVKNLDGGLYESVDLITGGYPCQPFATAGKRKGQEDDRHLWPEMLRIIEQARPAWVVSENVTGHITLGLDKVLTDLEGVGYAARPVVIPACSVGALHIRERIWVVAHTNGGYDKSGSIKRPGLRKKAGSEKSNGDISCASWGVDRWAKAEPGVPLVADGVSDRVARYRATGNAIVPQVAFQILKPIAEDLSTRAGSRCAGMNPDKKNKQ